MRIKFALIFGFALMGFSLFQGPQDQKLAEQFFATGEKLYGEGKYKLAADTLAKAAALFGQLKKTAQQISSANLQAECLANLGQCDVAGNLLQQSLAAISNSTDNQKVLADTYYYLARQTGGCARKFDDAIDLMEKSLAIKRSVYPKDDPSFAFDYTFLGYIYNSKGKYDSALIYLDQALPIRMKHLAADDIEIAQTLFNLAASYEGKSELGKALDFNQRSLQIRLKKLGELHATVSNSLNSIGRVYRKLGNNDRALEYYRQALEIRKNTLGATHPNVAGSYYEIGNLYGTTSDYHAAIEYIQQGNQILENNSQVANDVLPTYYAFIGKMYGLAGMNDDAKQFIQKAVSVAEQKLNAQHPYRAIVYNIAGEYYGEIADVGKQAAFSRKAIEIYRTAYGTGSEREADVVLKMAATHAKLHNTTEALRLYEETLAMYVARLGAQNPKVTTVYLGIGDVETESKNFVQAEKYYGEAFRSMSMPGENKALELRLRRGEANMYRRSSQHEKSFTAFNAALAVIDKMTQGYNNDASRIQLENDRRELYVGAMDVAWKLYDKGDATMLQQAFAIAEKSKATILLENNKDQLAKTMAGVPDTLVNKERDIRIELAYYKASLYQAQKNKDTTAIQSISNNIFDAERQLESFKAKLEEDFPAYFHLKYANPDVDLAQLQNQLPLNTTLLQYFVGDSGIYCFQVSSNAVEFKRKDLDAAFQTTVAGYQKSLTDARFIMSSPQAADSIYMSTARSLFSLLMLPKPTGDGAQKLIIIPDDFLAQLNFGTLLCEDVADPGANNYAALPYVNTRVSISYAYSTAFIGESLRGFKKNGRDFAGFAPSYEREDYAMLDSTAHPMTALAVRSGNLPLPGAMEEVNFISQMMQGKSWLNEQATETNFKKFGGDYDVLHLAMHSLLDDQEPRYSELLFNNKNDNENDGFLTIAEIYNLKLNAQLVVLSSCSSGFGKIQNGEGSISLSRAFSYAGCPSVVMSLWKVPDQVTASIMKNFYEGLNEGLSKDVALRAAQSKFTKENVDPLYRHPYYWAGFVVIGDTSPLVAPSHMIYYVSGISFIAIAGLFILLRRKKHRNEDHSSFSNN